MPRTTHVVALVACLAVLTGSAVAENVTTQHSASTTEAKGLPIGDPSSIIGLVANWLLAVAAAAGAIIAGWGLRTWRRELYGRAGFDLAFRIMLGVYEVDREIRQIRNVSASDFPQTQWDRLRQKADVLDLALLEARVLWGDKLKSKKKKLKDCITTLWVTTKRIRREQEKKQPSPEKILELDAILCGEYDQDDEFGKTMMDAVSAFEKALTPLLR